MIRYVIKRILLLIPVLIGVSLIVFVIISLAPGDAVDAINSGNISQEERQELREYYGLDQPVLVQYVRYMGNFVRGNMGYSVSYKAQVADLYFKRFPATLALAAAAAVIAILIAIPLGIYSALKAGSIGDNICTVISMLGISVPDFWVGLVLIFLFALRFNLLPAGEFKSFKSLILPGFTCGAMLIGALMRQTRSSMLNCLNADYLRTARSKGVSRRKVIWSHALRNALVPIAATAGDSLAFMMGGSAVTEAVYNWPGVGRLLVGAINNMDTQLICGCVIMQTIIVSAVMLLVDIAFAFIDPRIKAQYAKGG